jgi:methylglutaconyl-CoA hydratase
LPASPPTAPDAIALGKRSAMISARAVTIDAEFARLVSEHAAKRQTPEAAEGLLSFVEKREASWYPR